jgi:hypothetical protein
MVFRELGFAALYGTGLHQALAQKAVAQAAGWGILSFSLSSVEDGITERFSLRLREKGLPPEDEVHDGVILAETSLAEIPLLVTSDEHLLDVDEDALLLAFQEADLQPVHPPEAVVEGVALNIDNRAGKRELVVGMRQPATKRKKLDYPVETNGTRWAAEARKMASKLTSEQEAEHFRRAMVKVYGGQPKETTGAGR